jgi:hypothetical protein
MAYGSGAYGALAYGALPPIFRSAPTYPLAMPRDDKIKSLRLGFRPVSGSNESPFTFQRQVFQWSGERWFGELALVPLQPVDAGAFHAFFMSLDGVKGTFLAGNPNRSVSMGQARLLPGTPVVNGTGQTGQSLNIRGLPASRSGYLVPGDHVQLGTGSTTRLHMVMQAVNSDANGKATVVVRPRIKTAPADGAPLVVADAHGIWSLASNDYSWLEDATLLAQGITLAIQEPR